MPLTCWNLVSLTRGQGRFMNGPVTAIELWAIMLSPQDLSSEMRKYDMRKQKGFSLIELLIVVAIILIIAAIAIPNLMRARIAANEASAVASVHAINTAEAVYISSYPGT